MKKLISLAAVILFSCSISVALNVHAETPENVSLDLSAAKTRLDVTLTNEEDGLRYSGKLNSEGGSGWMYIENLSLDGSKYYQIKINIKIEDADIPKDWNVPYGAVYYTGTTASGENYGESASRFTWFEYGLIDDGDTLSTGGEFREYTIDTSKINGWGDCTITSFRFDAFKNAGGEAVIKSIELISKTDIIEISYDGVHGAELVPKDANSIDVYLSNGIYADSVNTSTARIINYNGNPVDCKVEYFEDEKKIVFSDIRLKSNKEYQVVIEGVKGNANVILEDPISAPFKVMPDTYEIDEVIQTKGDGNVNSYVRLKNSGAEDKELLVIVSVWNGNEFIKNIIKTVDVPAESSAETSIEADGINEGNVVELYVWDNDGALPAVISNEIYSIVY